MNKPLSVPLKWCNLNVKKIQSFQDIFVHWWSFFYSLPRQKLNPGLRGHKHLTESKDLRLWFQSPAAHAGNFSTLDWKKINKALSVRVIIICSDQWRDSHKDVGWASTLPESILHKIIIITWFLLTLWFILISIWQQEFSPWYFMWLFVRRSQSIQWFFIWGRRFSPANIS